MKVVCERCYKSAELTAYAKMNIKYGEKKQELALCPTCYQAFMYAFIQSGYTDPQGGIQGQMDMEAVDPETGETDTSSDSPAANHLHLLERQ